MRAVALVMTLLALMACASLPEGVQPVRAFDAQRYVGRWHEIARLDHRFERGLVQVTAEYSLREDGTIDVRNRGWKCADREWHDAKGKARFVDATDVGQLKVSFFWPFYSGYTVIALDPDYRYSMVAGNDHSYLWILARESQLPQEQLDGLVAQAQSLGFATDQLIYPGTIQDCPPL